MPAIYVLDVPEYKALVDVARTRPECRVSKLGNGYFRIEADREIDFGRKELGFKPALWYGCFTGGLRGRIVQFDRDRVRVTD